VKGFWYHVGRQRVRWIILEMCLMFLIGIGFEVWILVAAPFGRG
jgi:hypothetical protein